MSAPFATFAETADAVSATTKRLEKLAILAEYLSPLSDEDLAIACRFLSGLPFPFSDERTLNVGFSAASTVLIDITGVDPGEYGLLAVRLGDLGEVAAHILAQSQVAQELNPKSKIQNPKSNILALCPGCFRDNGIYSWGGSEGVALAQSPRGGYPTGR